MGLGECFRGVGMWCGEADRWDRYADVTHEVTPVTFGHRLVLTYNLVDTGPSDALHSAAEAGSLESKFKRIFERWRKSYLNGEEGPIEYVSCILDHQYTESSLSLANLKGKDKSIVSQAAKVAGLHEFTICLATVEATREGAIDDWGDGGGYRGDEDFIDEIESGFKLQQVVDLDGNTVAKEIDVNEESIVPKDYFKDEDPDDRDVEYTGNEGATAKLWYQKAVGFSSVLQWLFLYCKTSSVVTLPEKSAQSLSELFSLTENRQWSLFHVNCMSISFLIQSVKATSA